MKHTWMNDIYLVSYSQIYEIAKLISGFLCQVFYHFPFMQSVTA
jgi:hypothetical protein